MDWRYVLIANLSQKVPLSSFQDGIGLALNLSGFIASCGLISQNKSILLVKEEISAAIYEDACKKEATLSTHFFM